MRSSQRIRQTLQRYQRKPVTQQGILGNEVGTIAVPNRADYVYVRVAGLGTIAVYNKRVPLILNLPVDVGYDPLEPKNFQVLNIHRYPQGGGRSLVDVATIGHGKTHTWGGTDPVYIEKRQLMPLRPTPIGGMNVYITREVTYYDDQAVRVSGQQLDLSPYVPATGSWLVLLYKDTDELVKVSTGGTLKDIFTLSLADAPQAYPGTVPIALVRLYGGQSGITEGYQDTDLIDVRQLFSPLFLTGTSSGVVTGSSSGDTVAPFWYVDGLITSGTSNYGQNYIVPFDGYFNKLWVHAENTGVTGSTIIDMHRNGTSVFTDQDNRPVLVYNDADKIVSVTPDVTALVAGDVLAFYVDQAALQARNLTCVPEITRIAIGAPAIRPQTAYFTVDGDLVVATGKLKIRNNTGHTRTITRINLDTDLPPVTNPIIVDIHKNGTTILTDQAHRPRIITGTTTGYSIDIDVPAWEDGSYLTMDTDQVGGLMQPGSDLTVGVVSE